MEGAHLTPAAHRPCAGASGLPPEPEAALSGGPAALRTHCAHLWCWAGPMLLKTLRVCGAACALAMTNVIATSAQTHCLISASSPPLAPRCSPDVPWACRSPPVLRLPPFPQQCLYSGTKVWRLASCLWDGRWACTEASNEMKC